MELDRRRHKTVRETFSSRNDQSPYKTNMIIFVIGQIYNNVCVCVWDVPLTIKGKRQVAICFKAIRICVNVPSCIIFVTDGRQL